MWKMPPALVFVRGLSPRRDAKFPKREDYRVKANEYAANEELSGLAEQEAHGNSSPYGLWVGG